MNVFIKKQKGMNLIELMIAMTLGLVLSAGAVQIFISTKDAYRIENSLSRLQETGRYVVDTISKEIRMAGYNGCASRGTISLNVIANDPLPITVDAIDAIRGYDGSATVWSPSITSNLNITGSVVNTDVLNIQRADSCGSQLASTYAAATTDVEIASPNGCGFATNQVVIVTNCTNADAYQVTSAVSSAGGKETIAHGNGKNGGVDAGGDPLAGGGTLSKAYGLDAQAFRLFSTAYYIGTGASGEPALFRSSWVPNGTAGIQAGDFTALELIDGVENMQILYGEDTGGGDDYADTYVAANTVTDWDDVRSVRINLLLRGDDNITSEPRSILFNGSTVGGADNRLRMVYTSTISLRNRLP